MEQTYQLAGMKEYITQNDIIFLLRDPSGNPFHLSKGGLFQATVPKRPFHGPLVTLQSDGVTNPQNLRGLLDEVQEILTGKGQLDKSEGLLLSICILGTYCFRQLSSFPHLWFYVPSDSMRARFSELVTALVFAPFVVHDFQDIDLVIEMVRRRNPSILFLEHTSSRHRKWGALLDYPCINEEMPIAFRRDIGEFEFARLYSPRVILSSQLPAATCRRFSMVMPVLEVPENSNQQRFAELRGGMLQSALTLESYLKLNGVAIQDPLSMLVKGLTEKNAISNDESIGIERILSRHREARYRGNDFTDEHEILLGLAEFIRREPNKDLFFTLEKIAEFVNDLGLGGGISPKALSQFLSKRHIVARSQRPRIGNGTGQKIQRTAVQLDIKELKKWTPFVDWS